MPTYAYQGIDGDGREQTGTIEASTSAVAFQILQARDITVVDIEEGQASVAVRKPWYLRDIRWGNDQLSLDQQASVADLLASLFSSGLPADELIMVAHVSSQNNRIKRHFEQVRHRMADGMTFSQAFDTGDQLYSPMFIGFLKVSDQANAMGDNLIELAVFLKSQSAVREKVVSALVYPAVLIIAACALMVFVVLYLAPSLAPIFESLGRPAPPALAFLMGIHDVLRQHWIWVLSAIVGLTGGTLVGWRYLPFASFMERAPMVRHLTMSRTLAQLCHATRLLLRSGMQMSAALRTAASIVGVQSRAGALFREAATAVETGSTASSVFDNASELPATFCEVFKVGERANRLDTALKTLSEMYARQTDRQVARLLTLLTPALTLVLGLGIGFLIFTVMGAILEVNEIAF